MVKDDVEVVVLESRAGQVKLGFVAPPTVAIHRREIRERIKAGITRVQRPAERSGV